MRDRCNKVSSAASRWTSSEDRPMRRLLVFSVSLLALAGCATAKRADAPATPAIPADDNVAAVSALDARFAGTWYVSGVFPSATRAASIADPHLGSALVIGDSEVSDVNGQRCISPGFATDTVAAETAGAKLGGDAPWDRLSVTCDGRAFATYLRLPDRTGDGPALLQQRPEGLYLLEQAAALQHRRPSEAAEMQMAAATIVPIHEAPKVEAPVAQAAPVEAAPKKHEAKKAEAAKTAPMPMAEGPVEAAPAEPMAKTDAKAAHGNLPAAGTAMHLASYKGQKAAKRGWKILLGEYDELDPLSPLYVSVDVPGKGEMIRLYATGAEPAEIAKICAALKAKKVYCALNP
jgi:hypothetical protein